MAKACFPKEKKREKRKERGKPLGMWGTGRVRTKSRKSKASTEVQRNPGSPRSPRKSKESNESRHEVQEVQEVQESVHVLTRSTLGEVGGYKQKDSAPPRRARVQGWHVGWRSRAGQPMTACSRMHP